MIELLPYISGIVAFGAALIGVVGKPKWDDSRRGLRRLTATGRFVVTLAGVALISTFALTLNAQRAAEEQRTQYGKIQRLAHTELRLAIQELADPLVGVLVQTRQGIFSSPGEPAPKTSGKPFPFCMLDPMDYEIVVAETNPLPSELSGQRSTTAGLTDRERFESDRAQFLRAVRNTTRENIAKNAKTASAEIDRVLATYAAYLEPDVLYSVSELRRSRWLWQVKNLRSGMPVDFGLLDGRFRQDDEIAYQRFWKIVERLWSEHDGLYMDPANKELWGPDHFVNRQLVSSRRLP